MLTGRGIAGLLLTGVLSGRAGFRELGTRLRRWRFGARWYAIALLTSGFACAAAMWLVVAAIAIAQGGHLFDNRSRGGRPMRGTSSKRPFAWYLKDLRL
jgi:hypothetical protein